MQKLKHIVGIMGIYLLFFLINTAIYIGLMKIGFLGHITVLMYRGILVIFIVALLCAGEMAALRKWVWGKWLDLKDIVLMFMLFACVHVTLFTLLPVTVERSVSVFMLSYMEENEGQAFTEDEIADVFIDKYVNEYGAFEKRFTEQVISGNLIYNENEKGYQLTKQGKLVVKAFRLMANWFNTDQRLVHP